MKALTIRQPWCHLLITGAKRFECRTWRTSYRGPLVLHSASNVDSRSGIATDGLPRQAICAVGRLVECHAPGVYLHDGITNRDSCWFWQIDDIRPIQPIPIKGSQMLWTVPEEVVRRIRSLPSHQ